MIQDGLGLLWRRILALKYLLVLTICFNVLAATSGVICSIYMWKGTFQLSESVLELSGRQKKLQDLADITASLLKSGKSQRLSRDEAFKEMQSWERLRLEVQALGLNSAKIYPEDYFTNPAGGRMWLENLHQEIKSNQTDHEAKIQSLAQRESQLTKAVMWIAALTLVLGVALPLIIFSLILRALRLAQIALTNAAKDIVHDWSLALNRYGQDPFKNAHFWIEAILIVSEQLGAQSRHPAAMLSAELSHLVRSELHKSRNNAA